VGDLIDLENERSPMRRERKRERERWRERRKNKNEKGMDER